MDKTQQVRYHRDGPDMVEWDGRDRGIGGAVRAYYMRCSLVAAAMAPVVAPQVGLSDMPQHLMARERRDAVAVLVGNGDDPDSQAQSRRVSRHALALELHEPAAYWRRAEMDLAPIVQKVAAHAMARGDGATARQIHATGAFLEAATAQENGATGVLRTERGSAEAWQAVGALVTAPGALAAEGGPLNAAERGVVAAHAVMHARVHNRDARALERTLPSLSPEAQVVAQACLQQGQASIAMGAARRLSGLEGAAFAAQAAQDQDLHLRGIALHMRAVGHEKVVGLVGGAGVEGAALLVDQAQKSVGTDSFMAAHGAANRALMAHAPYGEKAQFEALGADIARGQVETRLAQRAQPAQRRPARPLVADIG